MKIDWKKIHYIIIPVFYVLGWVVIIAMGKRQDYHMLIPVILWGMDIYLLFHGITPQQKNDLIRRSLLLIIGSGIPLALSALTHSDVILIIAAFFWVLFTLAGIGIIASELGERRKKKPVKKYSDIAQKIRTCEKCGKTLQKHERQYCDRCRLAMNRFHCAGCGLLFQYGDLHVVDGKYYCHGCFESKYINVHDAEEEQKIVQIPCFTMIKNLFETNSEKEPDTAELKVLCDKNIFIIYTYATMQPLCYMDRLCAYDTREQAEHALDTHITDPTFREYFYPQEITPEHIAEEVKKALSSGFGSMAVNNQYVASLSCLPVYDENADYGIVCPTACNYMICYKERELALECDEDASGQERSEEEIEKQKALFAGIVRELGHRVLLLPDEKHRKKNVENKYVLMVFTDRFALNTYDTSSSITTTETDLDELYRLAEEDETIMGIVVNPGREDFRMKKY